MKVMVSVLYVTQSPMNKQQWLLQLACGHDVWVTSKGKPKRKDIDCTKCGDRYGK